MFSTKDRWKAGRILTLRHANFCRWVMLIYCIKATWLVRAEVRDPLPLITRAPNKAPKRMPIRKKNNPFDCLRRWHVR